MGAQAQTKGNKLILGIVVVVLVILGVGYLAGTSYRKSREATPAPAEVTVSDDEIPANVSRGSVEEASGGFELERGGLRAFPRDFPVFPGSLVASSWEPRSTPPFEGITVVWETTAVVSEVAGYYNGELKAAGWDVVSSDTASSPASMTFEKGQIMTHFWIGSEGVSTVIQVTAASK